jgi:hypothetical protein
MTTIDEVYCVPRTVEEHAMFPYLSTDEHFGVYLDSEYGVLCFDEGEFIYENGTEIPVTRFLDLLHDRIACWRLEEVGFKFDVIGYGFLDLKNEGSFLKLTSDGEVFWCSYRQQITTKAFVYTFTELLQLIRFLTPPDAAAE